MKEQALRSGNGNLFKNGVATSGKLHLTSKYIYHFPHAMNLNRQESKIALEEVDRVHLISHYIMKMLPVPNGLEIILKNGDAMRFVVNGRKRWKRDIEQALDKARQQTI